MPRIKFAALVGLLFLSMSALGQPARSYPVRLGAVNDYTGKLDQAQINQLASLINRYQRQTTIEIVVVVVETLEGQPARAYASGLGDAWGVGKAGRNNGIVLLWAPNERAYSLRIADGLSSEISDDLANVITSRALLPNFKRGDYYAGLKETVLALMEHLGNQSWEERVQARKQAAEQEQNVQQQREQQEREAETQRRQAQARLAEEDQKAREEGTWIGLGFLITMALGIFTGITIHRSRRRKARLAEMAEAGEKIPDHLAAAETNAPVIQSLLDEFAKTMPEQDVSSLRDELARQPERILKIRVDLQCLNLTELQSYGEMVRIRTNAETEADLLESTKERLATIRQAKEHSQELMENLSRENFEITEVRDSSRTDEVNQLLSRGRQDYQQARQSSSMSVVDWLLINELLNNSQQQVRQAVQCSQEEPYVPSRSYSDDSSSGMGLFGGGSSSSFGGGGSFSSDSGSSGGGGGFSSGSGSDGTY